MAQRLVHGIDHVRGERRAGFHEDRRKNGQAHVKEHDQIEQRQIMPRDPEHGAVGAADRASAADAFEVILAAQFVQLTAAMACRAERHGQFLFIERRLENVRTHLNDRDLGEISLQEGGIRLNVNFHEAVRIFFLQRRQVGFRLTA